MGMVEGDSIIASQARGEVNDPSQVQVLHFVQRCVQRAFLCGDDHYSGKSYEHRDPSGNDCSNSGRRAIDKGFLSSISLTKYLELLDWTGRQVRLGKAGSIPSTLRPIVERLGLEPGAWCDLVPMFGRLLKRAAGSPANLAAEATRRGQSWLQAPGRSAFAAEGT